MKRDVFFELVDQVLVDVGRAPLTPDGPQRSIVDVRDDDQVLQILAGPGSGKTEMLVWRVLFELFVRETPAKRLMVTTFTRRAATELSVRLVERAEALLATARAAGMEVRDPHVHDLRIGTIHSLCDSLLAEYDPGYMEQGLQLIDEFEAAVRMNREGYFVFGLRTEDPLAAELLELEPLVSLFRAPWDKAYFPSTTTEKMNVISRLIAHHTETWEPRCADSGRPNGIETQHHIADLTASLGELQGRWLAYLERHHLLDFTSIQRLFHERQDLVLGEIDHVFVDEFQDTNPIQFEIHTKWLAKPGMRLTVVGDDDQAMYRFRGSDITCFKGLKPSCMAIHVAYRIEKLEENWRSTSRIVRFSEGFRGTSVLKTESMPKAVRPAPSAEAGLPVRLLQGPWSHLGLHIAPEIKAIGAHGGGVPFSGRNAAILMFSTSERSQSSAASALKSQLETAGIKVYNPSNKTAAAAESPIQELFALISYLIDPVSKAPLGKNGGLVEVWASHREDVYGEAAISARPDTWVSKDHAAIQKRFLKGPRAAEAKPVFDYIDVIRERLVDNPAARLTLSGLVARLLSFDYFRDTGFTPRLFREAQFTDLLDTAIGATRRSRESMDAPLRPTARANDGKIEWPKGCWRFLSLVGMLLEEARLDDKDVEAFQEGAVSMLTFHQAKGLEFDHVYVAMTGREPNSNNVLQTMLFSGDPVPYSVHGGVAMTADPTVTDMALADREREVYVAITRAKRQLTILHDPAITVSSMNLNPSIEKVFASTMPPVRHGAVAVRSFE